MKTEKRSHKYSTKEREAARCGVMLRIKDLNEQNNKINAGKTT